MEIICMILLYAPYDLYIYLSNISSRVFQMSLYYMFEDPCCDTVKQPMFTSQRGTRSYAIINALDIITKYDIKDIVARFISLHYC